LKAHTGRPPFGDKCRALCEHGKAERIFKEVMGGRKPKLLMDIHSVSEVNKVDLNEIQGPATRQNLQRRSACGGHQCNRCERRKRPKPGRYRFYQSEYAIKHGNLKKLIRQTFSNDLNIKNSSEHKKHARVKSMLFGFDF
jgi:hypothetical protein